MFWLIILAGLVADQVSKLWISANLQLYQTVPLLDGIFHLTYVHNDGAAFSLLSGQRVFFVIATVVAVVAIIVVYYQMAKGNRLFTVALALLAGGALGNFIDRLRLGYVVDFFDFCLINFPVFNIADCCVVIGVALLIVEVLRRPDAKKKLGA